VYDFIINTCNVTELWTRVNEMSYMSQVMLSSEYGNFSKVLSLQCFDIVGLKGIGPVKNE